MEEAASKLSKIRRDGQDVALASEWYAPGSSQLVLGIHQVLRR
jgi:hypothetical protein